MLTIKKRITSVKKVEVEVINFKWCGEVSGRLQALKCSACKKSIGKYRCCLAWIKDGDIKRALRLCNACGKIAEETREKFAWRG